MSIYGLIIKNHVVVHIYNRIRGGDEERSGNDPQIDAVMR